MMGQRWSSGLLGSRVARTECSNLTLENVESYEPRYTTRIWYTHEGGAGDEEACTGAPSSNTTLSVMRSLCRGSKPRASSTPRPYLMMLSSPGAAVGAGKAVTNGKSASAAAQGTETFIGCGTSSRMMNAVKTAGSEELCCFSR
jgi:hypothetical protein